MLLNLLKVKKLKNFPMPLSHDGVMVILSSPSGAGKTALVKLLSERNNFITSISHATRKPRDKETPMLIIIL